MMSPRQSTYKRQCVDTEAFHLTRFQIERESIRAAFGEGSELMKSPRERQREMLEKLPVEVTPTLTPTLTRIRARIRAQTLTRSPIS
jgi:hypothetical protein